MLTGRYGEDATLFRLAGRFERDTRPGYRAGGNTRAGTK
jgi:hypothetical protein